MPKVIDSFLFFQEIDLLDIRLAYLDPYVDTFVIVEASQTFTGKPKPFVFEENKERYSKYAHKIYYHKILDAHTNFESIIEHLKGKTTDGHSKVLQIMQQHIHYPKTELQWVLDTYHRECIHLALEKVAAPDDIVILSDLDEIPSERIFQDKVKYNFEESPYVCQQYEFRYFLNFYNDSNWLGSILSAYKNIYDHSLNILRIDSKVKREIINKKAIYPGGYHFTSCGNLEDIAKKIQSWGHQEFNNKSVLKNLEKNIKTGQDIFERELGTKLTKVSLSARNLFDSRMAKILSEYPNMLYADEIVEVKYNIVFGFALKVRNFIRKVIRKIDESLH